MFCPHCRTEYREGIYTCSDCGAALVHELPGDEEHDGSLTPLANSVSPVFIGELVEALEEADVPYVIHAGTALALLDGQAGLDELSWEARVSVADDEYTRAHEILERVQANFRQK